MEQKQIDENRIYLTWKGIHDDIGGKTIKELQSILRRTYPDAPQQRIVQNSGQFNIFANKMSAGDVVLMPRRGQGVVQVGRITSDYRFDPSGADAFRHYRTVEWSPNAVPRSNFDSELLHKLNAATTFCGIKGDDVEHCVANAIEGTAGTTLISPKQSETGDGDIVPPEETFDWEQQARDEIHKLIQRRFKGHDLETLIDAILRAQGYGTHRSPIGADKGVDILAARGPLGFENPRLAVQIKSETTQIGRQVLDQLIGAMQNCSADYGLLVSWSGFKDTVTREVPAQFFRVRLWTAEDVARELLDVYERLPESLRAEIPLKRIWVVAETDEAE
ncbi:MAG: restriction endonuclease [Planctomycetes bacterium]|nr:restriction endonuclease [Planctomycetota bacterium]